MTTYGHNQEPIGSVRKYLQATYIRNVDDYLDFRGKSDKNLTYLTRYSFYLHSRIKELWDLRDLSSLMNEFMFKDHERKSEDQEFLSPIFIYCFLDVGSDLNEENEYGDRFSNTYLSINSNDNWFVGSIFLLSFIPFDFLHRLSNSLMCDGMLNDSKSVLFNSVFGYLSDWCYDEKDGSYLEALNKIRRMTLVWIDLKNQIEKQLTFDFEFERIFTPSPIEFWISDGETQSFKTICFLKDNIINGSEEEKERNEFYRLGSSIKDNKQQILFNKYVDKLKKIDKEEERTYYELGRNFILFKSRLYNYSEPFAHLYIDENNINVPLVESTLGDEKYKLPLFKLALYDFMKFGVKDGMFGDNLTWGSFNLDNLSKIVDLRNINILKMNPKVQSSMILKSDDKIEYHLDKRLKSIKFIKIYEKLFNVAYLNKVKKIVPRSDETKRHEKIIKHSLSDIKRIRLREDMTSHRDEIIKSLKKCYDERDPNKLLDLWKTINLNYVFTGHKYVDTVLHLLNYFGVKTTDNNDDNSSDNDFKDDIWLPMTILFFASIPTSLLKRINSTNIGYLTVLSESIKSGHLLMSIQATLSNISFLMSVFVYTRKYTNPKDKKVTSRSTDYYFGQRFVEYKRLLMDYSPSNQEPVYINAESVYQDAINEALKVVKNACNVIYSTTQQHLMKVLKYEIEYRFDNKYTSFITNYDTFLHFNEKFSKDAPPLVSALLKKYLKTSQVIDLESNDYDKLAETVYEKFFDTETLLGFDLDSIVRKVVIPSHLNEDDFKNGLGEGTIYGELEKYEKLEEIHILLNIFGPGKQYDNPIIKSISIKK